MRIKTTRLAQLLIVIVILSFFGYFGYRDLIYDEVAASEAKVLAHASALSKTKDKPQEYYGVKRAEIALTEYHKDVGETKHGCNCGPEVDKYTQGHHAQWCTMFASWIANEAGSPVHSDKTNSWRIVNSRDFARYLQEHGTWYSREDVINKKIQPKAGDFMVFWRGKFEDNLGHVDVVIEPNSSPGSAKLLGGNLRDRVRYREFPYLQYYGFLGFGRPEKD